MILSRLCRRDSLSASLMAVLLANMSVASDRPPSAPAAPATTPVVFSDCQIGGPLSPERLQARCTTITVPEDRAHPEGRKIGLRVAVLKARASTPKPDPLVFIAGGPGQASTEAFVQEAGAFEQVREERDVLLVDQR